MTDISSKPGQELFKFFERKDPAFYNSFEFRLKLPELFGSKVKEKIGTVLNIPKGLRFEDPDIDNLADATFAKCQTSLDPYRIAKGETGEIRCFTCWAFLLRVAFSVSIDFLRKKGRPWNHEEFSEDLLIANSGKHDLRCDDGLDKEALHSFLASHVPPDDLEMFFLRYADGLPPREIHERFKQFSANYISVKIHRAMVIARRVLTTAVIEQLKRGKNEQRD
jgi:DNA-directed RNA polymerase specialized sigma24 family protein